MAQPRHLSIDARLAGPSHAGIGRYEAEIIRRLISEPRFLDQDSHIPVHWHLWIATSDDLSWLPTVLPHTVTVHRTKVQHYSFAEQVVWPRQLASVPSDLLWVPHFNVPLVSPIPWVVTLHDLLWHQVTDSRATTLPPWKHRLKHLGYRMVTAHAARGAEAIMVPSNAVAEDVRLRIGENLPVTVTYEGVAETYLHAKIPPILPDFSAHPTLLYVGSLYPHKNVKIILQALRALPEFKLEVVSARNIFTNEFEAEAERLGVRSQVQVLGYLTDVDVLSRAHKSVALVQPSTSEGFGLTGLEGLAMGVPVVASDLPVFQELYGRHAAFFPRHDAIALSQILKKLWKHPPTVAERVAAQQHARHFTWQVTTQKTWNVIAQAWKARYGDLQ